MATATDPHLQRRRQRLLTGERRGATATAGEEREGGKNGKATSREAAEVFGLRYGARLLCVGLDLAF